MIYKHDERICEGVRRPDMGPISLSSRLIETKREQVIDPLTAYQITSILEGVIQRGTGIAIKEVGKNLAGKTGTTNDAKDLWFVGFSPEPVRFWRVHGLRQTAFARGQRAGRALHRADLSRLYGTGAQRHPGHALPHSARHQAYFDRPPLRHASDRIRNDHGSVQARHRGHPTPTGGGWGEAKATSSR